MSETKALFDVLRQSADSNAAAAIEKLVQDGSDRDLCRINVLDFAKKTGINEERAKQQTCLSSRIMASPRSSGRLICGKS